MASQPDRNDQREEESASTLGAARKILELMSRGERRRMLMLVPAVTLTALVQVVGIASVMPFLTLVSNPNAIDENRLLAWVYDVLNFGGTTSFLVFVGLGVLVILVLSNGVTALTEFMMLRFAWNLNHTLSVRMLREYLLKPYTFFLDQNTAGLAKNLLAEVKQAVKGFIIAGIKLASRGVVAVFILALLVAVNPVLALITFGFLGGTYGMVFWLVRRQMSVAGVRRSKNDRARFKAASEALLGVKDIKLLGRERPFLERYARPSQLYSRYMAQQEAISVLPRYAFETIAFGGMLVIILYLLVRGQDLGTVLPTLGVYAFASYRLLPALQSLFSSMTKMRFSVPAVEVLHQDLERAAPARLVDRTGLEPLPFREKLELRAVAFYYPGTSEPVLHDFDLSISPNTSVALVGATGSGKSTTADILLGLLTPQRGQLVVDGTPVDGQNMAAWQKSLGYVPQQIYLADDTVAANIAFGVEEDEVDMEAVERAARLANIHDFIVAELPRGYDSIVGERGIRLSGGQRQRLGIARALYHDPAMLVLDEATSALDNVTEEGIFQAVREIGQRKTVVMIAHRLTTVRACDVVYLIEHGRIVASGSYDELVRTSPKFRAMANSGKDSLVSHTS